MKYAIFEGKKYNLDNMSEIRALFRRCEAYTELLDLIDELYCASSLMTYIVDNKSEGVSLIVSIYNDLYAEACDDFIKNVVDWAEYYHYEIVEE